MQIYISHSTQFDYKTELYAPLKSANNCKHQLYLPHEQHADAINTRKIIEFSDVLLAEVSHPSTGQGIEIAWAADANVTIVCIHKQNTRFSSSLALLCKDFYEYANLDELMTLFSNITKIG